MAEGFGDNIAAKALEESTHYVSTRDGTVLCNESIDNSNGNILTITSTVGSFQLTQASRVSARAVATTELHGTVVDWGCGGGLMALLAANQPKVERVIGLDYEAQNIVTCRYNARQNGLEEKTEFYRSDSFQPFDEEGKKLMAGLKIDFVIANPPASSNDDGFSFRRRILKESIPFLKPNSKILLQAQSYYGPHRFVEAAKEATDLWASTTSGMELRYEGVVKSSDWREIGAGPGGYDFQEQIQQYCREEEKEKHHRYYCGPRDSDLEDQFTAKEAMALWKSQGKTPICQWQVHSLQWASLSLP